jgi:hypothetical protein
VIKDVSARDVRHAVGAKGFAAAEHGNRDHEMFFLVVEGKKTSFWVKISHGSTHLFRGEIKRNAKSLGVKGDDLYRIVSCEYNAEQTLAVFAGRDGP